MGENYIWIHSNIFPGKGFWFYENLTGNIRDLTRFGKPDILGNKLVQRKKNRQITRFYRIHQLHLITGTVALVEHHRTNQDLPLQVWVPYLQSSPKIRELPPHCGSVWEASSTVAKELLTFWAGFTRLLLLSQWLKSILKKHIDFYFLEFSLNEIRIHSYFAIISYMHEKINFEEAKWFSFPWIFLINRSISINQFWTNWKPDSENLSNLEEKLTKELFMYLS